MKALFLAIAVTSLMFLSGCGNLSPRQQPKIDDNQGQIQGLENMANSIKLELANLQSQAEIQNSKLDKIQQGLANFQSTNENSGVQILSGSGGLVIAVVTVLGCVIMVVFYRTQAQKAEKTANILAERVISYQDPVLEDSIFQAAMYTEVEENILNIMKKHKN